MPVSDETLDEVERALDGMTTEYNRLNFMQTADFHREGCTCLRCWRDRQQATLARLRAERGKR